MADLIEVLKGMDAKATKGPWEQRPDTYAGSVWVTRPFARGTRMVETVTRTAGQVLRVHSDQGAWPDYDKAPNYPQHENDAALIVSLRNSLPALIAFIEAADDCCESARNHDCGPSATVWPYDERRAALAAALGSEGEK